VWSFVERIVSLIVLAGVASPQVVIRDMMPASVAQGTDSQITDPRQVVVRTEEEWRSLWAAHSPRPVPPINFSRAVVVGLFLGSRPTAGFRVEITGATLQGEQAIVRFVEYRPAPDAILAQVLTSPFHLVTLPAEVRIVRFERVERPSR
jgi:hypothetical protein